MDIRVSGWKYRKYLWIWNDLHFKCISFHKPLDSLQVHPSVQSILLEYNKGLHVDVKYKNSDLWVHIQVIGVENLELFNRFKFIHLDKIGEDISVISNKLFS